MAEVAVRITALEGTAASGRVDYGSIYKQLAGIKADLSEMRADLRGNAAVSQKMFEAHATMIAQSRADMATIRGWVVALVVGTITTFGTVLIHLLTGKG